jgi:hypothetical protein
MAEPRLYKTPQALRTALETRLQDLARREATDIQRLRRRVAFDRFLARLFVAEPPERYHWFLKGGYAMELRMRLARATKDIDLTLTASSLVVDVNTGAEHIRALLHEASSAQLPDGFIFLISESMLKLDAPPEGGSRFPVQATMAGRTFAKFHVDVGIGEELIEPTERIQGEGWFDFAGLPRPEFRMISREQQFAEKVHAYSLPRGERENSRVKDLIDLVLLRPTLMDPQRARLSIEKTFARRSTHPIPAALAAPPETWQARFETLAKECGLTQGMEQAFQQVASYFVSLQ